VRGGSGDGFWLNRDAARKHGTTRPCRIGPLVRRALAFHDPGATRARYTPAGSATLSLLKAICEGWC